MKNRKSIKESRKTTMVHDSAATIVEVTKRIFEVRGRRAMVEEVGGHTRAHGNVCDTVMAGGWRFG